MAKVKLKELGVKALKAHAVEVLGLEVPKGASKEDLITIIKQVTQDDEVEVADSELGESLSGSGKENAEDIVEIIVESNGAPGGTESIYVGHNGNSILIPRGVPVKVKRKYADTLSSAIQTHTYQQRNAAGEAELVMKDSPAYSIRYL